MAKKETTSPAIPVFPMLKTVEQMSKIISASWVSSQFGKLLEDLDMPHIRFHDLRHPYVKHTTKIFSLRSMAFPAQA